MEIVLDCGESKIADDSFKRGFVLETNIGDYVNFRFPVNEVEAETFAILEGKVIEAFPFSSGEIALKVYVDADPEFVFTQDECILDITSYSKGDEVLAFLEDSSVFIISEDDFFEFEVCDSCGEKIVYDDYSCSHYLEDKVICSACHESDMESASTIVKYSDGDKEVYRIGMYSAYSDCDELYSDDEIFDFFEYQEYHSTDGWRGYYDLPYNKEKLTCITSGWVTGWADESHEYKNKAIDLNEILDKHSEDLPFTLYWVFSRTSNVFSTASEILVPDEDVPAFKTWLSEVAGLKEEEIERAFG